MKPEEIESEQLEFTTSDGWTLRANSYSPPSRETKAIILMLPAMGSHSRPARFLASALAKMGNLVVTLDPRGHGKSTPHPKRGVDFGFDHILQFDLPAVITTLKKNQPDLPLFLMGHSLGGYLTSIFAAENPDVVNGVITLTSAHLHSKYIGRASLAVYFSFAALSKILGYLPGQYLGWGAPMARRQVLDWANWGMSGTLRGTDGRELEPALSASTTPTLCIGFTDDLSLAPSKAVKAFSSLMPADSTSLWEINPSEIGAEKLGHFEHLRTGSGLWPRIDAWINDQI
ncbi:MAG: alpha/beta fold hydrolase [Sneathiella sp.]